MTTQTPQPPSINDVVVRANAVIAEVQKVYVGSPDVPRLLLTALLAGGHALLEGVPGVAKTTLCKTFAATLACSFKRVQFTPDLLPADITGTYVFSPREGTFQLRHGPIFANVVLADEINRAPAKTQSALLESMQEQQATIEGSTLPLPSPFIVLATQNPIEHSGTYPLPEAQLDRFLLRIAIGYPTADEERAMLQRFSLPSQPTTAILDPADVLALRQTVSQTHVEESVVDYVVRLAGHTRTHARLALGVSPRASLSLLQASRAWATLDGRAYVTPDDIRALAKTVWAHRVVLTAEADLSGASKGDVIDDCVKSVALRRGAR